MRMLQTHAPAIFSVTVFIVMRFRPSTRRRYVCVLVLTHFQERFQIGPFFNENAQRISVNGRPKRIEMCQCVL